MTASTRRAFGPCARSFMQLGEVIVIAPATEQSAVGHSVTLTTPLVVQEVLDEDETPPRLGRRGPSGGLRQAGTEGAAARAARPDRQRPQRWVQRGHQRPLLRHGRGGHRGGVLQMHQHRLFAGVREGQAARFRARRGFGPAGRGANPRPSPAARDALQRQHPRSRQGPVLRHSHGAAERDPVCGGSYDRPSRSAGPDVLLDDARV